MKQHLFYFLAISTTLFLYSCSNIEPTPPPPPPKCDVNLEEVFLVVDTTYALEGENNVGIDLFWTSIDSAVSYTITTNPGENVIVIPAPDTTVSIESILPLNADFFASLSATLANGAVCGPVTLSAGYCNGGGTADDILQIVNWPELCDGNTCDFVRFLRKNIKDCNGNFVDPIPWNLRNGLYYKRQDVCDCLTDNGAMSVCDGVESLRLNPCLQSLPKCLKHDYQPCN
jgi:hypothetical protein